MSFKIPYRNLNALKIIILVLGLVIIVALYTGSMVFESHHDIKKGSFTYYVFIPEFIKNFPILDPVSDPNYYSIPLDCHPGSDGVKYTTYLDFETVSKKLSSELDLRGVTIEEEQIVLGEYISLNRRIPTTLLIRRTEGGGIEVTAYEEYF